MCVSRGSTSSAQSPERGSSRWTSCPQSSGRARPRTREIVVHCHHGQRSAGDRPVAPTPGHPRREPARAGSTPGLRRGRPGDGPLLAPRVACSAVTREGGVARLTLSRPPLNVLTPALIDALGAAFRRARRRPGATRRRPSRRGPRILGGGSTWRRCAASTPPGRGRSSGRSGRRVRAPRGRSRCPRSRGSTATCSGALWSSCWPATSGWPPPHAGSACRRSPWGIPRSSRPRCCPASSAGDAPPELLLAAEPIDAVEAGALGLVNRAVADDALDREVQDAGSIGSSRCLRTRSGSRRRCSHAGAAWTWTPPVALSTDVFARAYCHGRAAPGDARPFSTGGQPGARASEA